jgi:hypothetical protein
LQVALKGLQIFAARYAAACCSQNAASVAAFFVPNGRLSVTHVTPPINSIFEILNGGIIDGWIEATNP